MQTVSYQPELSPALRVVVGNVDYSEIRETLSRIDQLLMVSGLDIEALFPDTSCVTANIHFPVD